MDEEHGMVSISQRCRSAALAQTGEIGEGAEAQLAEAKKRRGRDT
jgi:hypothetical protein